MNQRFEMIPCSSGELPEKSGFYLTDLGAIGFVKNGHMEYWSGYVNPEWWLKPIPAPEPIPEGEGVTCQKCGNRYRVDLMVPDALWNHIKPEGKENGAGLLCGHCIISAMEAQGYGHLICQGEAPTSINIQELIPIRDYFGENDKTPFQHRAFSVLDKIINKRAPTRMTLQEAKDEVARKCNDYIKRYDNWETMENALATELPRVLLRRLEKAAELYASGSSPVQGEAKPKSRNHEDGDYSYRCGWEYCRCND